MNPPLRIESWSHRGLGDIAEEWCELLGRSQADPLFNSPEWLTAWWREYQAPLESDLHILAALEGSALLGLALMHKRTTTHRVGRRGRRLEMLGTARGAKGIGFSERLGFIVAEQHEARVARSLAAALLDDPDWDEVILFHVEKGQATEQAIRTIDVGRWSYLRSPDSLEAWELGLAGGYDAFLASLGSGTRSRVIGSRARLAKAGCVRERILGPQELDEGWEIFSRLHEQRWQRPFSLHWRRFYGAIATSQAARGVPVLSILEFEGQPVSALVNFRAGLREYSIASAFIPVDVKRVSIGWMHLGLAIQRACADGMTHFDFLGGEGKHEQYKAAFGGDRYELIGLQLLRRRDLALIYRLWDSTTPLRNWIKARLTRWRSS